MKKIIFVERDETNYDPVAAFFNKKAPSVPKGLNSTNKQTAPKANVDKKGSIEQQKGQKPSTIKKIEEVTPKIGQKGMYQTPNVPKPYPLRQQAMKTRDLSRTNTKKQSKSNILKDQIPKIQTQKSIEEKAEKAQKLEKFQMVEKDDSIQKMKDEQPKPIKRQKVDNSKLENFSKKIKQLEQRQLQYQRKIEQLEAKEEKYVKNQQKLLKIQKDMKAATQKSREGQAALQKLKQKQGQIKQMLQGSSIPFNRRRQVILNNKIRQLKRLNKELILRIKNYKGSDLVELATPQNRQQITNELYTIDVQKDIQAQMNAQMESFLVQLINKLKLYLQGRVKEKGERSSWVNEQTFILQLINLSEKISLNYLNNYELSPMPKSNEEAISAYSILEQYKNCNQMKKIMDRYDLNLILSKQNMEIINSIQAINEQQQLMLKSQVSKSKRKRQDDKNSKFNDHLKLFERRNNFTQILLIQNICQVQFIKSWLEKATAKVNSELQTVIKIFTEIKDIVELGPSAKESLYLYLDTNLSRLQTKFPSLKLEIKQVHIDFNELQKFTIVK